MARSARSSASERVSTGSVVPDVVQAAIAHAVGLSRFLQLQCRRCHSYKITRTSRFILRHAAEEEQQRL